jgi:hypothetical protein
MYENPGTRTRICYFFYEIRLSKGLDAPKVTLLLKFTDFRHPFLPSKVRRDHHQRRQGKGLETCRIRGILRLRHLLVLLVHLDSSFQVGLFLLLELLGGGLLRRVRFGRVLFGDDALLSEGIVPAINVSNHNATIL